MKFRPRFTLRTLLVLIALMSIPLGWVASQLKLMHDRKRFFDTQLFYVDAPSASNRGKVPWFLRLLGDRDYESQTMYVDESKLEQARRLFPEARIKTWSIGQDARR